MNGLDWRDRQILVTGARGFIGSRLCRRLLEEGAEVHGVTRVPSFDDGSGLRWISADFADSGAAAAVVTRVRPDVIFHLAGEVTGSQQLACVAPTFAANLASTVHLLTAAAERGSCRVVLAGSMREPSDAGALPIPGSPYAASKWACTAYARMFHALYHLPVAIARLFMVYGPGQWDVTKVLPYSIVSLLRGESPRLASGIPQFDWVYIDDIVDALVVCATSDRMNAEPVDFGTGMLTSVRQVVEQVVDIVGPGKVIEFGVVADRSFDDPPVARADETERLIGWRAQTPLDEGLARTVDWYRAQLRSGTVGGRC